jgi:hypothetical protein
MEEQEKNTDRIVSADILSSFEAIRGRLMCAAGIAIGESGGQINHFIKLFEWTYIK